VIVDALGNLIRFVLLPGQRHDITSFDALMAGICCLALIGDKGFDAGWLRERLRANDMEAVIPLREGTSGYAEHDGEKYKWRHLVENFLLQHKSLSTHCHALREDRQMLRRHHQPRRHRPLDKVNVNRP
jgi:Transposase DDE domain